MRKTLKIIGILALIGIIAAFLVYRFVYNKPHPDYEKEVAEYTLSAKEFYDEFKNQTVAANKKYTGKMIQVKGELDKVIQTDSLTIGVFVFSTGMFGNEGIRCTLLPKYNQKAKNLSTPANVSIKGLCTGYNDTDVIMEHCSFN
ncbi:MAG: OB-fold putative lipoprotein [Bacteroidales bacterium]|nr:OB-fold putative lipoprotein [Bacteroidales bacterium]MCF8332507.1 OB-fold putative lipoprotein [Bacteroidales bacterium]